MTALGGQAETHTGRRASAGGQPGKAQGTVLWENSAGSEWPPSWHQQPHGSPVEGTASGERVSPR